MDCLFIGCQVHQEPGAASGLGKGKGTVVSVALSETAVMRASWGPHTPWQRKGRDFLDPRQSQTLVPGEEVGGVGVEEGHLRDYLQSPGLTFLDPSPTFQ